jgi:GTP-binding protein Era
MIFQLDEEIVMLSGELVLPIEASADHRSGYVAIIGKPNVGKSTLLNALLGQKIAIVSEKPQTTRTSILGILTRPDVQVIFVDTPGLHKPLHKLGEYMVETAKGALPDADLICFVADVSTLPTLEDEKAAALLQQMAEQSRPPVLLVLNKVDLVDEAELGVRFAAYRALFSFAGEAAVSALRQEGLDALLATIIARLPLGPRYYPEDQVTDQLERDVAAELIREQAMHFLRQELPYSLAVEIEEFKEKPDGNAHIQATLYVEKESQKGIVIGRGGSMLKQIGQAARQEIETMTGVHVFLELWVKVREDWRKKDEDLRRFGYALAREK